MGELSVSGFAPEIFIGQSAITSTGELLLTGYAPEVEISRPLKIIYEKPDYVKKPSRILYSKKHSRLIKKG